MQDVILNNEIILSYCNNTEKQLNIIRMTRENILNIINVLEDKDINTKDDIMKALMLNNDFISSIEYCLSIHRKVVDNFINLSEDSDNIAFILKHQLPYLNSCKRMNSKVIEETVSILNILHDLNDLVITLNDDFTLN